MKRGKTEERPRARGDNRGSETREYHTDFFARNILIPLGIFCKVLLNNMDFV